MSCVTTIWVMAAAVALTLGAIHAVVWIRQRKVRIDLLVFVIALAVATCCGLELALMKVRTLEQMRAIHGWMQLPLVIVLVSLVVFIHWHFQWVRPGLLQMVVGSQILLATLCGWMGSRMVTGFTTTGFLGEPSRSR